MITVLIDGPSGAGKTTLARQLAQRTGFRLVSLDSFYPGWSGLAAGAAMVAEDVLAAQDPGYREWDWEANTPGSWVSLAGAGDLIVEGVGAITEASVSAARARGEVLLIRVSGPRQGRYERAIARDPFYAEWFEMWEAQERVHFAATREIAVDLNLVWEN